MYRKIYWGLLLWLLPQLRIAAQYHDIQAYTNQQGLSGIEILLPVVADAQQRIWISVNSNRLNVLTNGQFHHFGTHNGLIDELIEQLNLDGVGRLWCFSGKGASVLDAEQFYSFPLPQIVQQSVGWQQKWGICNVNGDFYAYNAVRHQLEMPVQLPKPHPKAALFQVLQNDFQHLYCIWGQNSKTIITELPSNEIILSPPVEGIYKLMDNILTVCASNKIYQYRNKQWLLQTTHPDETILSSDDKHLFLLKSQDKKFMVREWSASSLSNQPLIIRNPHTLKAVTKDAQGIFWFSSDAGLLKVYPHQVTYDTESHPKLKDLHTICADGKNNIWFGSYTKGFSYLPTDDDWTIQNGLIHLPFKRVLPGSLTLADGTMLYSMEDKAGILATDGQNWKIYPPAYAGFTFKQLHDGQLIRGLAGGIAFSTQKNKAALGATWQIKDKKHQYLYENALAFVEDSLHRIWTGRLNHGIAVYDASADTFKSWKVSPTNLKSFGIETGVCDRWGNLWFGGLRGLHLLRKEKQKDLNQLSFDDFEHVGKGIIDDKTTYALWLYRDSFLLTATEKGWGLIHLPQFYAKKTPQMLFFNGLNGFSAESCEQNTVLLDPTRKGKVWIGHDKGATLVDLDALCQQFQQVVVKVDSVVIKGQAHRFERLRLDVERQENYKIYFSAAQHRVVGLAYRNNAMGDFTEVVGNHLELSPATESYALEVRVLTDTGNIGYQTFEVKVPPIWYLRPIFVILVALSVILGVYIVFKNREKRAAQRAKQHELEQKIKQQKLTAIGMQLNPHFFKNSLNWLQGRFRRYEDDDATDYIQWLNENMKKILNLTGENKFYHSLADEMDFTESYLKMEIYRRTKAKDYLEYEILPKTWKENWGNLNVPLLQLQIHCENAVKHGFNKGRGNYLKIEIQDVGVQLRIEITDNGMGHAKAKALKQFKMESSDSTGLGTQMLKEMHLFFNEANASQSTLQLTQQVESEIFTNDKGELYGSKIIIHIPKKFNYNYDIELPRH